MRNSIVGLLFVSLIMLVLIPLPGARASAATIPHGTVDLVAENQWIAPGSQTYFGLNFHLEKGWHIYWVNPGDSGQPPRVQWHLPSGLSEGEIEWPAPRRLGTSTIVDFGYDDAVMLLVPVRSLADLGNCKVNLPMLTEIYEGNSSFGGATGCYAFTRETIEIGEARAHARFFIGQNIGEDPATGSAAGPLGGYLVHHGATGVDPVDGVYKFVIEQGDFINRPSRIGLEVKGEPGKVEEVRVGGTSVVVARGQLEF